MVKAFVSMWCLPNCCVYKDNVQHFVSAARVELVKIKSFTRWVFELIFGQQTQDVAVVWGQTSQDK